MNDLTPQQRVNEAARLLGLNVEATNGGVSYTDALSDLAKPRRAA
jgi:hypothetical protein